MSQFERLDQMLMSATPGDAWGDDRVLLAVDVLRDFEEHDWSQLAGQWADRPEVWQCLAADVLVDGDARRSVPLLVDMIGCGQGQARVAACDSLRVLLQGHPGTLAVGPNIKAIIGDLERYSSGLVACSLRELHGLVR